MYIGKVVNHLISNSEYLSKMRYNRMMRSVSLNYDAHSKNAVNDFNKLFDSCDVIANYAKKNHLKIDMEVQENLLPEGEKGFVRQVAITARKFGHELKDAVVLQKDNKKPDFVHTKKEKCLIDVKNKNASDGTPDYYVFAGKHTTQDSNFIRSVYRTIESLNNKLNRIARYE